jgi:O-antigen ligase
MTSIGEVDFVLLGLFYAVPIFSVLWSENPAASLPKCAALAITTVSVWVCASRLSVRDYAACLCMGLLLLLALSTVLIIFVPEIGLMHTWEHAGVWAGIFNQKQSLGIATAVLTSFSMNLFFYTGRKLFLFAIGLSFAVALGSGSRGGVAALIIGLVASVSIWRVRPARLQQWVAAVPLLVVCGVTILIISLLATGGEALQIFGFDLDISSRTFIWQHGLQRWADAPFLGTGLDAFWHNDAYYFAFLKHYGWVLNDFHNGYIEILSEAGLFEYFLMITITLRLTKRLRERVQFKFEYSTIASFMIIFYVLNASETFFLRSTSFMQTTFLFFLIKAATRPLGSWSGLRQDPLLHLVTRSHIPTAEFQIRGARP